MCQWLILLLVYWDEENEQGVEADKKCRLLEESPSGLYFPYEEDGKAIIQQRRQGGDTRGLKIVMKAGKKFSKWRGTRDRWKNH